MEGIQPKRPHCFSFSDLAKGGVLFEKLTPPARLGILGCPVAHSLSPLIQNAALRVALLPLQYVCLEITPEELPKALEALRHSEFLGVNVTLPHKQEALALVDEVSDHARLLGAINTIVIRHGKLYGHNTDGPGFIAAVKSAWNLSLADQRVLILGATGGAGRAIAAQCALEGCRELYLASRTLSKLAAQMHIPELLLQRTSSSRFVKAISLDATSLATVMPDVDLIVNATSVGMQKNDPSLIPSQLFHPGHFLYETIYSSGATSLMQAALNAGASATNGLSMLVHQGVQAFRLWFDDLDDIDLESVMKDALINTTHV